MDIKGWFPLGLTGRGCCQSKPWSGLEEWLQDDSVTYLLIGGLSSWIPDVPTGCLSVFMTWQLVSTKLVFWVNEKELAGRLEKAMAPHSSTLAWKIPWMEESGRLQSMGSLRVGHSWVTSLSLFTCMHWRRKWQPTPVFLPGESQGRGSLVGCRPWGCTELDTTEAT